MFRIDERDIKFNLYEYLQVEGLLELPAFQEMDKDTFDILLDNAFKFSKDVLAPINTPGDKEGCHIDEKGNVTVPEGYKAVYKAYCEDGWIGLSTPPEHGGTGAPQVIGVAASEAFVGACVAMAMYPGLTRAAVSLILDEGNDAQRAMYGENMLAGIWGGTMCLTEAGAGSAVGDNKTSAVKIRDGFYKIVGQKIFISSGDHDMVDNNVHLVLARTPDAPSGVKGLSLFIVPKYRINEDGSLGEFNDVNCVGIEHKMGIKGSSTCTLAFGENDNCEGWLIGNEGDGIKIMFHMMNEARLGVGLQSLGVAAASYLEALDYSRDRIQGVDMRDFKNPDAKRVAIIEHPDVKKMLLTMRAYVTSMRALMMRTALYADQAAHADGALKEKAQAMVDFLTPICKGYGSDQAFEVTRLGIQVLGGYGFISEYPQEQHMRDAKIFTIYEGTNGIQAMDLVGRKMATKGGALFMGFMQEMQEFLARAKENDAVKDFMGEFEQTLNDLQTVAMTFMSKNMSGEPMYVLQYATVFLKFMGNLVSAWLLSDHAIVADAKLKAMFADKNVADAEAQKALIRDNDEAAYYDAKVKTARFFCKNLLPENRSITASIVSEDTSVLDVVL